MNGLFTRIPAWAASSHGRQWHSLLLLALVVSVCGCSTYQHRAQQFHAAVQQAQYDQALELTDQLFTRNDKILQLMTQGWLLHQQGQYKASNEQFELAKELNLQYLATSVSENIGSVIFNENVRTYVARPYEHLLIHFYVALNYLYLDSFDNALVEMRQADVSIQRWSFADAQLVNRAAPLIYSFSGLLYEMNRQPDEALIAYQRLYDVTQLSSNQVFAQQNIIRLASQLKRNDLLDQWPDRQPLPMTSAHQIINIRTAGTVSQMVEQRVSTLSAGYIGRGNTVYPAGISVALPYYPPYAAARVPFDGEQFVYDVNQQARTDLESRIGHIQARAFARVAGKIGVTEVTRQESPLAALLLNIIGNVNERADTRSWSVLPATISLHRLWLNEKEFQQQLITLNEPGFNLVLPAGSVQRLMTQATYNLPALVMVLPAKPINLIVKSHTMPSGATDRQPVMQ